MISLIWTNAVTIFLPDIKKIENWKDKDIFKKRYFGCLLAFSISGSDYDSYAKARLTRHDSLLANKMEHIYGMAPTKDTVSLVLSMPQNGTTAMNSISNGGSGNITPKICPERTVFASLSHTTLPRDYKVKKVYL